jgi:hypothetical protein
MMDTRKALVAVLATVVAAVWTTPALATVGSTDGYIYGTVITRTGNSYTGPIRWGDEEAFWDDLFHSAKEELPYSDYAEEEEESEGRWWQVFSRKMQVMVQSDGSRIFMARFGDIKSIKVVGKDDAEITMKDGTVFEVSGYANDVGTAIAIRDATLGEVELEWKKIDTIEFATTPPDIEPAGTRLHGTVITDAGEFDGYIQWDKQECLSVDRLDGDTDDGRMSIPMGSIASIERRSKRSATVILRDGRELELDGTNDVNDSIRGIVVEDPRYGRVEISWDEFERADFREPGPSGPGYDSYGPSGQLRGTVTDTDGNTHAGAVVFDLDEAFGWEFLNGKSFDIEYNIPFDMVASVVPRRDSTEVTLKNGEELRLEDGQDVSDSNDGVVVELAGGGEEYVPWKKVKRIDFE